MASLTCMTSLNRRELLETVGAAGLTPGAQAGEEATSEMPRRDLGRTGEKVSSIGVGGFHLGLPAVADGDAVKIVRTALDRGLNFLDNSWDYNDGRSELLVGKALRDGYRQKAFVMTKIDGRTRESAAKQIDQSLLRLGVEHVDLLQFHEVIRFEDADRIFAPGGALEAFLDARKAGKLRFIGFTGHKDPHIHLYMLHVAAERGFHFDTVQMPINLMDPHFRSFTKNVVPVAVREGIGILGMKSMGSGVILKSKTVTPLECLHFALSQPTSVVITGMENMRDLNQAFQAAQSFERLTQAQVSALLAKTAKAGAEGEWELFKTTQHFDSTALHPEWLGQESARIKRLTS
jgi:aryl-alcohol dehydrogenase-like predicted oxidoreductase